MCNFLQFPTFSKSCWGISKISVNPNIPRQSCGNAQISEHILRKSQECCKDLPTSWAIDRNKKHPTHFNLDQSIKISEMLKPKKTILTNLHSDLDYNFLLKNLPRNVKPAYDGMSFLI